jgi:hypothetical protein
MAAQLLIGAGLVCLLVAAWKAPRRRDDIVERLRRNGL